MENQFVEAVSQYAISKGFQHSDETSLNIPYGTFYGFNNGYECIIYLHRSSYFYRLGIEIGVPDLPEGLQVTYPFTLFSRWVKLFGGYREKEGALLYKSKNIDEADTFLNQTRTSILIECLSNIEALTVIETGLAYSQPLYNINYDEVKNVFEQMGRLAAGIA
jgi:hypothetical protein